MVLTLMTINKRNAEWLTKLIHHKVRYAMPIGEENKPSSKERTGGWSKETVDLLRDSGTFIWVKQDNKWMRKIIPNNTYTISYNNSAKRYFSATAIRVMNKAIYAELYKSGNCIEMASLAIIKFCESVTQGNLNPNDKFLIELIECNPSLDHVFTIITINGSRWICDPWLNLTCAVDEEGLAEFKKQLLKEGYSNNNGLQYFIESVLSNQHKQYVTLTIANAKEAKHFYEFQQEHFKKAFARQTQEYKLKYNIEHLQHDNPQLGLDDIDDLYALYLHFKNDETQSQRLVTAVSNMQREGMRTLFAQALLNPKTRQKAKQILQHFRSCGYNIYTYCSEIFCEGLLELSYQEMVDIMPKDWLDYNYQQDSLRDIIANKIIKEIIKSPPPTDVFPMDAFIQALAAPNSVYYLCAITQSEKIMLTLRERLSAENVLNIVDTLINHPHYYTMTTKFKYFIWLIKNFVKSNRALQISILHAFDHSLIKKENGNNFTILIQESIKHVNSSPYGKAYVRGLLMREIGYSDPLMTEEEIPNANGIKLIKYYDAENDLYVDWFESNDGTVYTPSSQDPFIKLCSNPYVLNLPSTDINLNQNDFIEKYMVKPDLMKIFSQPAISARFINLIPTCLNKDPNYTAVLQEALNSYNIALYNEKKPSNFTFKLNVISLNFASHQSLALYKDIFCLVLYLPHTNLSHSLGTIVLFMKLTKNLKQNIYVNEIDKTTCEVLIEKYSKADNDEVEKQIEQFVIDNKDRVFSCAKDIIPFYWIIYKSNPSIPALIETAELNEQPRTDIFKVRTIDFLSMLATKDNIADILKQVHRSYCPGLLQAFQELYRNHEGATEVSDALVKTLLIDHFPSRYENPRPENERATSEIVNTM